MFASRLTRALLLASLTLLIGAGCISVNDNNSTSTSGPAGVFVSVDKGEGWSQLAALPTAEGVQSIAGVSVYRIFEDPQDSNAMYLTTRGQGMFYSYDSGKTWQQPTFAPLAQGFVYSVAVHPKDKCLIYATNGVQVFKSTDCSRNWEEVYREGRAGVSTISLAFEQHAPYTVFMAKTNGDILTSRDGGGSWTTKNRLGMQIVRLEADPFTPGRLYLATRNGELLRTDESGNGWIDLSDSMSDFSGADEYRGFSLHPTKPNTLFWLSTYGIMFSTDAGESWRAFDLITPPGSVSIFGFGVNPENDQEMYYTASEKDLSRSTFYRSIDGGVNWTTKRMPSGQIPTILRMHPEKGYVYLGFAIPVTN